MPVLTIIAGPNGAGKSTHSKDLVAHLAIEAFDFDKEFYSIWSQFSFDPAIEQGAFDRAQLLYIERRAEALQRQSSFAFETNYHTQEILSVIDQFKTSGYKLELIFICLEDISIAIERVKERVAKGGHQVSEEIISERFKKGLALLDESFLLYDNVSIYLSKWKNIEPLLSTEPQSGSITLFNPFPEAIKLRLKNLDKFLSSNIA